mmetsp:Transcript_15525/g.44151  ORF Transcript_15525/g.44151 Transcript_15525/m.44151 type:complete len:272 (+) Transcript_15525:1443-2258(+)
MIECRVNRCRTLNRERIDPHDLPPFKFIRRVLVQHRRLLLVRFHPLILSLLCRGCQRHLQHVGRDVDGTDGVAGIVQLFPRHQIDLVQQHEVRERNLVHRLVQVSRRVLQVLLDVLRIHKTHDGVQPKIIRNPLIREECERHRRRVCQARRLEHHRAVPETFLFASVVECLERAQNVIPQTAAHATLVHRHEVLLLDQVLGDQRVVNVHLPHFVFYHSHPGILRTRLENVVHERRLSGSKESGHQCDGNLLGFRPRHCTARNNFISSYGRL